MVTGDSPLIVACRQGHSSLVKFLLDVGADVEQRNVNGKRPLHEACFRFGTTRYTALIGVYSCIADITKAHLERIN